MAFQRERERGLCSGARSSMKPAVRSLYAPVSPESAPREHRVVLPGALAVHVCGRGGESAGSASRRPTHLVSPTRTFVERGVNFNRSGVSSTNQQ
jgi:hypothetical protein